MYVGNDVQTVNLQKYTNICKIILTLFRKMCYNRFIIAHFLQGQTICSAGHTVGARLQLPYAAAGIIFYWVVSLLGRRYDN